VFCHLSIEYVLLQDKWKLDSAVKPNTQADDKAVLCFHMSSPIA